MQAIIQIRGTEPLIQHSAAGLDTRSEISQSIAAITAKRGSNRTEPDDERLAELETQRSLWLDAAGKVTVPPEAIRSCIETAARKLKQGPNVREGLMVEETTFEYDRTALGATVEELGRNAQFTVPVVVQRNRIMRTRAKFDTWSVTFTVDYDDELVDEPKLAQWLDIAGRRIGLGDWRPACGGRFGRFETLSIKVAEE